MARALYRVYLYLVCVVLLGFVAYSIGNLLGNLLLLTPLRGQYETAPDSRAVAQSVVLAVVALIVSGVLGGLHYWLIRRDIRSDGDAALGAVRASALNLVLVVSGLIALFSGISVLQRIGYAIGGGVAGGVAVALTALAVYALVEWERRRGLPRTDAARDLERLQMYGVSTIALIAGIFVVQSAVRLTLIAIFLGTHLLTDPCQWSYTGPPACDVTGPLVGQWLAVVWVIAFLVYYALQARGDKGSILRLLAHYTGLLIGLVAAIVGVQQLAELVMRAVLRVAPLTAEVIVNQYDFVPPLLFGALVVTVYVRWLLTEGAQTRLGAEGTRLTVLAVAGITLGVPLYLGVYWLLNAVVESAVHGGFAPSTATLATGVAALLAGALHPFLAELLRRRSTADAPIGPRRALIFAGLAAGALMAAIGIAIVLYLLISNLIGTAPAGDWAAQARQAGEVALVGLYLAGIHGWRLYGDRKIVLRPSQAEPLQKGSPTQAPQDDVRARIATTVDDVLAGRITRDEAVTRLVALRNTRDA
jgi:hypothetical protein